MKGSLQIYPIFGFLFGVAFCLISCTSFINGSSKIEILSIGDVKEKINAIKSYHVKLTTKTYQPRPLDASPSASREFYPDKFVTVVSDVHGISGKKIRIETKTIPPDMDLQSESKLINNGKWLWVEIKVIKIPGVQIKKPKISAMKIHVLDVSPDPNNQPFNTIYGQDGTGIFRYTDLPGTLKEILSEYSFRDPTESENSDEIVFLGVRQSDHKIEDWPEADKEMMNYIERRSHFCKIWVSKRDGLINAYLIGESERVPNTRTEIKFFSINEEIPSEKFEYRPPENVVVRDATEDIIKFQKTLRGNQRNQ